jgi:hypothetical protein
LLQVNISKVFAVPGGLLCLRRTIVAGVVKESVEERLSDLASFSTGMIYELVDSL